jgi:trigger factor
MIEQRIARFGERNFVNVTVEHLAACRKLLRIEVDSQSVDADYEKVTSQIQKQAVLPGFRAGKAPRAMVVKAYTQQIDAEVRKQVFSKAYHQAVKDQNLKPVGQPDVEEIQFGRGTTCQFAITMDTAPEFDLPNYKGLPVRIVTSVVTDKDMERAMDILRQQRVGYKDVVRPASKGDFLVVNFKGTCQGQALSELAPTAQALSERTNYWIHLEDNSFLPEFVEQLPGASAGERRQITVRFPDNFTESGLAGKECLYDVEVLQVKEAVMPEVNDEFAKTYGANDVEALRAGVKRDLEAEMKNKMRNEITNQIVKALLDQITCELPESTVTAETRNVVYDLVRQNKDRGVSKEAIDEKKDQIYSFANNSAKDRVKAHFILDRIAEKENIKASKEEILQRLAQMSAHYQIPLAKFVRQLEERDGISEIADRIIKEKVIDFLKLHAKIEELPAEVVPVAEA